MYYLQVRSPNQRRTNKYNGTKFSKFEFNSSHVGSKKVGSVWNSLKTQVNENNFSNMILSLKSFIEPKETKCSWNYDTIDNN